MYKRRWSTELPPDLLGEISGRLHAADFVRFHAVCRSWRDSHSRGKTSQLLPWLLAPNKKDNESIKIRCVFSKTGYRAPPSTHQESWLLGAAYIRYSPARRCSGLPDPLAGAAVLFVPPLPHQRDPWDKEGNPSGIVYDDGTILLVSNSSGNRFRAVLLRSGDTAWTFVERDLELTAKRWHLCGPNHGDSGDPQFPRKGTVPRHSNDGSYQYGYALQCHGELLWVSVQCKYPEECTHFGTACTVLVHILLHETTEKFRWVRKDGRSLADRVLFLGWPNSFAMDASGRLAGDGGCVYFVHKFKEGLLHNQLGVVRYNLDDEKGELVERLPREWQEHDETCTWIVPQPSIAPIQEINERLEAPRWKHQTTGPTRMIHIERCYGPCFKVFVRNLPPTVHNPQLQHFFSKQGKVSNAEVIYYKKTKASQGVGLVTIATTHEKQADALSALNKLVFDGCRLEVSLVKKKRK